MEEKTIKSKKDNEVGEGSGARVDLSPLRPTLRMISPFYYLSIMNTGPER